MCTKRYYVLSDLQCINFRHYWGGDQLSYKSSMQSLPDEEPISEHWVTVFGDEEGKEGLCACRTRRRVHAVRAYLCHDEY